MKRVIIVGGFLEIFELCELSGHEIIGYIDISPLKQEVNYPWLGVDDDAKTIYEKVGADIAVVITPDAPPVRAKLFSKYQDIGYAVASLVSPKALISPTATLKEGCVIQSFCNVSSEVEIGVGSKINTKANVMHNSIIGDFVTIAPGATVLGHVTIGREAYIGANSTILPGCRIGRGAIIGAGSVVTKDVAEGLTVVGIPAQKIGDYH